MKKLIFIITVMLSMTVFCQRENLYVDRHKEFRGQDSGEVIFVKNLHFSKGKMLKLEGVKLYVFGGLSADESNHIQLKNSTIFHVRTFPFENENIKSMRFKTMYSELSKVKCRNWTHLLNLKKLDR